jgi:hypothetical protein
MASAPDDVKIRARLLKAFENHTARFVPPFADRLFTSWELFALGEHLSQVRLPFYDSGESEDDIAGALLVGLWAYGNLYRVILYGDQRKEFEGVPSSKKVGLAIDVAVL